MATKCENILRSLKQWIPFTKVMLADYLLANRSALSKELRKMENDGLITVNKRVIEIRNNN